MQPFNTEFAVENLGISVAVTRHEETVAIIVGRIITPYPKFREWNDKKYPDAIEADTGAVQ